MVGLECRLVGGLLDSGNKASRDKLKMEHGLSSAIYKEHAKNNIITNKNAIKLILIDTDVHFKVCLYCQRSIWHSSNYTALSETLI